MPVQSKNQMAVTTQYTEAASMAWNYGGDGARKVNVYVDLTDAVMQIKEGGDAAWLTDEIVVRQGFSSIGFLTPIVAVRFKVWPLTLLGSVGTVDGDLFA